MIKFLEIKQLQTHSTY